MKTKICTIVGSKEGGSKWSRQLAQDAHDIGEMAARCGFAVLTGGLSGVMEYAAKGAKSVGGLTIGILPGEIAEQANSSIDIVIPSGIGLARNSITALAGDVLIALPGGLGTLQEMTYALEYGRAVISFNSFEIEHPFCTHCKDLREMEVWLRLQVENYIKGGAHYES